MNLFSAFANDVAIDLGTANTCVFARGRGIVLNEPSIVAFNTAKGSIEAVGTDAGQGFAFEPAFPAHHLMHGANKFGLASLTNLDKLPPTGAVLITAPLKIEKGSGSPLRVLALVAG